MAQLKYGYSTPVGEAGGIIDLAPYAVDTFTNEEDTGKMGFGVGVVTGTAAGKQVKLPVSASTAANFEGVVTNRRTTEYDLEGKIHIRKNATVGVMRYGRIYVRVATGATPAYGKAVYMLNSGDEAGYFTDKASTTTGEPSNTVTVNHVAVKGRFLGEADTTRGIAAVELFNEAN